MSVPYLVAQNTPKPVPITPSSAAISGLSNKGREAISAAQIAHPEYYHNSYTEGYNALISKYFGNSDNSDNSDNSEDTTQPSSPPRIPVPNSGKSVSRVNIPKIEFINADLAKHYGMSKSTAYQEALLNTAYQREVADMKAAGLNPSVLYSAGRASGADTSLYPSDASRSGSGGSRRRSGGYSKKKLFSTSAYSAIQAIGGLIGLGATKRPDGFWIGSQTAKGAMGLLDSLWKK